MKKLNKLLALVLAFCMILSMLPVVSAADGVGDAKSYDIVFMSDLHNGVGGYNGLKQMVTELKNEGQNPRVFSHGGDYVEDNEGGRPNWQTQVYDVITGTELGAFPNAKLAFTMGNHDWESGTFSNNSNKEAAFKNMFGFPRAGLTYTDSECEIYMIGAQGTTGAGGGGESFIQTDIDNFSKYLDTMDNSGKVVFLQTHWPAHSGYNFKQRVVTNSDKIIDLLNAHADKIDLVWIWGHNHYEDEQRFSVVEPGGQIMYKADTSGSSWGKPSNPQYKTIKFTYANAGCMNDMWFNHDGHNDTSASNNYRGPAACLSVAVNAGNVTFTYNRIQNINNTWTYQHDANFVVHNHNVTREHPATVVVQRAEGGDPVVHEHSYVKGATVAPTCEAAGYTTYTCSCGDSYKGDEVAALGHNYKDGKCTRCGAKDPSYKPVVPTSGAWVLADAVEAGKTYVIVANDSYALNNTAADSTKLGATAVTVKDGVITSDVTDDMLWSFKAAEGAATSIDGREQFFVYDQAGAQLQRKSGSTGTAPMVVSASAPSKPNYATWSVAERGGENEFTFYVNSGSDSDYPFTMNGDANGFNAPGTARSGWDPTTYGASVKFYELVEEAGLPDIDFTNPADASKFEVINQKNAAIADGTGLKLTATRPAFETCNGQNSGDQATNPEDVIAVPVAGDWTATLEFDFSTGSAANGYYQFFGFYASEGEDYQNMAGIRGGDGAMQNFTRIDGTINADNNNSEPGLASNGTYWYRIEKVGTTYICSRSSDGEEFVEMFTYEDTGIEADQILIDAYTGMTEGYEFTLKSLTFDGGSTPVDPEPCKHEYAAVVTEPTCLEGGYTTYTCELCGDSYVADEVAALGHSYKDGVCTRCGAKDPDYKPDEPTPATGKYAVAAGIEAGKTYVIVANDSYALNNKAASDTQLGATAVTVKDGKITSDVTDDMLWSFQPAEGAQAAIDGREQFFVYDQAGAQLQRKSGSTGTAPMVISTTAPSKPNYATWSAAERGGENEFTFYCNSYSDSDYPFTMNGGEQGFNAPGTNRSGWDPTTYGASVKFYELVGGEEEPSGLKPGPNVVKDPASPTGYTVKFLYENENATSVVFHGDIGLKNWADRTDTKQYTPQEYKPGLMRSGGFEAPMEKLTEGEYAGWWYYELPLAAGANQYWFTIDGSSRMQPDPNNMPLWSPNSSATKDAYNTVYVPYDDVQDFEPMKARTAELPREDGKSGTWSYVPIVINDFTHYMGVYLPYGYDPDRAEPYKTIYMLHGMGQDESDWMGIGSVQKIMDNLSYEGKTEPAVIVSVTSNNSMLGAGGGGFFGGGGNYDNVKNSIIPFIEKNYNVSDKPEDRAWAGLSMGSSNTQSMINAGLGDTFGYFGCYSLGNSVNASSANLDKTHILFGDGSDDFGALSQANIDAVANLPYAKFERVCGGHDFNTWCQLFRIWCEDYLWNPAAFGDGEPCAHEYAKVVTAPTCLEGGFTTYTCSKCGDSYKADEVAALGHDYKAVVTAPTCTEKGYTTYTCSKCGDSYKADEVAALGHDYKKGVCTRCGAKDPDYVEPENGFVLADKIEAGKQYVIVGNGYALTNKTASVSTAPATSMAGTPVTVADGAITSEVTDDMIWTFNEGKSAVCGEFTEGYFLTNGDSKLLTRGSSQSTGTAPLDTNTYTASTIGSKDYYGYWIVRDQGNGDKSMFLYSNANSEEYVFAMRGSSEGFDAPGQSQSNIDSLLSSNIVRLYEVVGATSCEHEFKAGQKVAATCTEAGYTVYTCSKCGKTEKRDEVKALGHDYKGVKTEPTCTAKGYTTFTCSRCSDTYKGEEVAALGHDFKAGEVTAPTCTAAGYTTYECSRCDATEKRDEVAALGHKFENGKCTECGAIDPEWTGPKACPSEAFPDAPEKGNWAHEGIDFCIANEYMNGTGGGLFSPDGDVTRAQLVTIIYRIEGEPETEFKGTFNDVEDGLWYSKAIEWAAANGIVNGVGEGKFDPTGVITREQIATIFFRYAKAEEGEGSIEQFPDAADAHEFAVPALGWAVEKGIINGVSTGGVTSLKPLDNASRAQIASIIMRYLEGEYKCGE